MGGLSPQQALSLYDSDNPIRSANAYRASNYSAYVDGAVVRLLDWREPSAQAKMAHRIFRSFVLHDGFSCVGAKGAVASGGHRFGFYEGFPTREGTEGLARDLAAFVAELPHMTARYRTFTALFDDTSFDEFSFEARLWKQLAALHEVDRRYFDWDPSVSSDPSDPSFAFSVAGHGFFVIGMHPSASRVSRRLPFPALIFNSQAQFKDLKASGHFTRVQQIVRERELALQGSLNPNLADYGVASEARQYSGRAVDDDWRCPFRRNS
ncbi:MAG: YqcI/YcgG family protein [Candidatus Eremiobacteraeota bacterium]|nr:YqcI/YcgG family protein [Candidatus Eremiobacteraeota bacterium]